MQEQLNRIRNKDYSQLDQKLYSNMGITSELDSTIAQLAELQKYLKSQIDCIEDEGKKEAAMRASKVVMSMGVGRGDEGESRMANGRKCGCLGVFGTLLEKVRRLGKCFRNLKEAIHRETRNCVADFGELINEAFTHMIDTCSRKNNEISKLKLQLMANKQQLNELKLNNTQLQQKLEQWQQAQQRRKHKLQQQHPDPYNPCHNHNHNYNHNYNHNHNHNHKDTPQIIRFLTSQHHLSTRQRETTSTYCEQNPIATDRGFSQGQKQFKSLYTVECDQTSTENDCPVLPAPLRRDSSAAKIATSMEKYSSCANSRRQLLQECGDKYKSAKNSPALAGNKKGMATGDSPSKKLRDKENQMLKMKGTQVINGNNRKSTKKLKLFHLI